MEQKYWKSLGILSVRKSGNHVVYLLRLLLVDAVLGNLLQIISWWFITYYWPSVWKTIAQRQRYNWEKYKKKDVKDLKYLRTSMNFVVDLFCFLFSTSQQQRRVIFLANVIKITPGDAYMHKFILDQNDWILG